METIKDYNFKNKEGAEKTYALASLKRIFCARFIDYMLVSIPTFLFQLFYGASDLFSACMVLLFSFSTILTYFILIPTLFKGNTIGKWICGARLRNTDNRKIRFVDVLARESYFMYIPFIIQSITQIVIIVLLNKEMIKPDIDPNSFYVYSQVLSNLGYLFFIGWFVYVAASIVVQENHQSGVDLKLKLVVTVRVAYEDLPQKKEKQPLTRDMNHIHLKKDQPGNIDDKVLEEILGEDKDEI